MHRRALGLAAAALAAPSVRAQPAWPSRPIRMIVPFPPGGATDATARLAAQKLGEGLGHTVVVENRAGGNGIVGTAAVLAAPADGHTILGAPSTHPLARLVLRNVPYDPVADFVPVARTAQAAVMLIADPRRAPRDAAAIVAAAKASPRDWSLAIPAFGAAGHLAAVAFNRATGAGMEIVPYRGTAAALTDVHAGNVPLLFDSAVALLPSARAGNVRAIGICSAARSALMPELPTFAEQGVTEMEFASWYAVFAARGTDPAIVARMAAAIRGGLADASGRARLAALSLDAVEETAEETAAFMAADVARTTALLQWAGFTPE